jgi:[acyl-carrier-protein] S-malonyltransferase
LVAASHGGLRWFAGDPQDGGIVKTALVFPGQGAQFVGMGRELIAAFPEAKRVFEEADDVLGFSLSRICLEGPEEELRATHNTQPAIFVHSIAVLESVRARAELSAEGAAGHSLGEYSAYVAAGSLQFADALRLVRRRGELMFEAGRIRPGTMAAVLGLDPTTLQQALESVPGIVVPANLNSPGQIVISGEVDAVRAGMDRCKEAGAKRVIPLEVSGAFHSPLMEYAAQGLSEALASIRIEPSRIPVYANVSASPVTEPEAIRLSLVRQLLSPVRWEESVRAMRVDGFVRFVELGPGKVLSGLIRSIDRAATTAALGGPEDLASLTATEGA